MSDAPAPDTTAPGARPGATLQGGLLLAAAALFTWLLSQPWIFTLIPRPGTPRGGRYVLLTGWTIAFAPDRTLVPASLAVACQLVVVLAVLFAGIGILALVRPRLVRWTSWLLPPLTAGALAGLAYAFYGLAEHTRGAWATAAVAARPVVVASMGAQETGDLVILRALGYPAADAVRATLHLGGYLESPYWMTRIALLLVALPVAVLAVRAQRVRFRASR